MLDHKTLFIKSHESSSGSSVPRTGRRRVLQCRAYVCKGDQPGPHKRNSRSPPRLDAVFRNIGDVLYGRIPRLLHGTVDRRQYPHSKRSTYDQSARISDLSRQNRKN